MAVWDHGVGVGGEREPQTRGLGAGSGAHRPHSEPRLWVWRQKSRRLTAPVLLWI